MIRARPTLLNRHPRRFQAAVRQWPTRQRALVEGDSWFRYDARFPFIGRTSNLFLALHGAFPYVSLLLSDNGDTVENMLAPSNVEKLRALLIGQVQRKRPFHYLFFSGGGNDVVNALPELLRPYEPGITAPQCLRESQVQLRMLWLSEGYRSLVYMRDRTSPGTQVVTHNYGVPNVYRGPFRRWGIERGPWIRRAFGKRGYHDPALMTEVTASLMTRFARVLAAVPGLRVADTASCIRPRDWQDEMHLSPEGHQRAAVAFERIL